VRGDFDGGLRRQSLLADVEQVIRHAHEQGLRVEVIAGILKERYDLSDSRAELIARDQVLKANGRLAQARQQSVGITEYIWVTSRDKRVRETHARLHNTRQSWANPPPVGGGRSAHPGGDYQCRCTAKPVAPSWLDK
jgi:SPP1 gp7 family putative phage head morphogenesis protein